jgi:hypothetical protein
MTEEQARSDAEALAIAMGITFYVAQPRGRFIDGANAVAGL